MILHNSSGPSGFVYDVYKNGVPTGEKAKTMEEISTHPSIAMGKAIL